MKSFLIAILFALIISMSLPADLLAGQGKTRQVDSGTRKEKSPPKEYSEEELKKLHNQSRIKIQQPGRNFYIQRIESNPGFYSLMISDQEGKIVTGEYRLAQIDIFEAIMTEAAKFAISPQGVGTSKPIVTRFFDKQEPSFFVDVVKQGNESQFFITVKSISDQITVDTGKVKRSAPQSKIFFHEVLARIKEVVPKEDERKQSQQ